MSSIRTQQPGRLFNKFFNCALKNGYRTCNFVSEALVLVQTLMSVDGGVLPTFGGKLELMVRLG